MVEITDENSARAWLETQPQQVCVAMAARAALRAVAGLGTAETDTLEQLAMPTLRAVLTSTVAASDESAASEDLIYRLRVAANAADTVGVSVFYTSSSSSSAFSAINAASSSALSIANEAAAASHASLVARSVGDAAERAAYFGVIATNPISAEAEAIAAYCAFEDDAHRVGTSNGQDALFWFHVWPQSDEPMGLRKSRAGLIQFLHGDPAKWDFWARWYRGMFEGRPMDWALQRKVALIPEDVWKAGPEAVARQIAEIERDFKGEPLDQEALGAHVKAIVATPVFHADAAESVATTLDAAIRVYCRLADANELPDGFAKFSRLEAQFRTLSTTLRQGTPADAKIAQLQEQINDLHGVVGNLKRELAEARSQLVDARLSTLEAERLQRSGTALFSSLANAATIGAFGLGAMAFFGVKAEDFGYDTIRKDAVSLAEQYAAPTRSPQPQQRPTSAPTTSPRPEPR